MTQPPPSVTQLPRAVANSPRVLFACADDRKPILNSYVIALERYGYEVELLSGPAGPDPVAMQQAAKQLGKRAIYLLCGSTGFGPRQLQTLENAIVSQAVPGFHIWAGAVDWRRPNVILREVEHRLAALGLEASQGSSDNVAQAMATRTQVAPPRAASTPPPPPPAAARAPVPTGPEISAGVPTMSSRSESMKVEVASSLRRFLQNTPLVLGSGLGVVAIVIGIAAYTSYRTGSTEPTTQADASAAPGSEAAFVQSTPAEHEAVRAADAPAATDETTVEAEADVADAADIEPPADGEAAAAQPGDAADAADAPTDADPEAAPAGAGEIPADPTADEGDPAPSDPVDELTEAEVAADQDAVYAALKARKIRSLDILLVAPLAMSEPTKRRRRKVAKLSFESATAYCDALDIDGVTGWRLPTIGELTSLDKAKRVDDYLFWSSTRADTYGTERLVWNARKARNGPAPTHWKGGRVICVRFQRPADDDTAEPELVGDDSGP